MVFYCGVLMAQDRSILFEKTSFQEALNKAKTSGKMLFVDCYTSWCGPCKKMATSVFTQNDVADYFNKNFISLKVDCEKGEGPELAKRFHVSGYPTMVFLDGEGNVLSKLVGGSDAAKFLQRVKKELDPEESLIGKEKRYLAGNRNRTFVLDLISSYKDINESKKATKVSLELLSSLDEKELLTKEIWEVISYYFVSTYHSKWWNFIFEHSDDYARIIGKQALSRKVSETMHPYLFGYAVGKRKMKNQTEWQEYKSLLDQYPSDNKDVLYHFLNLGKSASFDQYFKTLQQVISVLDVREHYRIFSNVKSFVMNHASEQQKKSFVTLIKTSRKQQNIYLQGVYDELLIKLQTEL